MSLFARQPRLNSGPSPGDVTLVAGWPVRLGVNARASRVSLRLDAKARQVVATAPTARRLADALAFARQREDWIAARMATLPAPAAPLAPGAMIEVEGQPCRLERAAMRIAPRFVAATLGEPARLIVAGEGEAFARAVNRGLRTLALERLGARTTAHAAALGKPMPQIAVMDARGRWGSCRQPLPGERAGKVRYNWRLIMAPPAVLDYVAAHECAHLVEANHQPAFWAVVARLYGDHRAARRWLKTEGARLFAEAGPGI